MGSGYNGARVPGVEHLNLLVGGGLGADLHHPWRHRHPRLLLLLGTIHLGEDFIRQHHRHSSRAGPILHIPCLLWIHRDIDTTESWQIMSITGNDSGLRRVDLLNVICEASLIFKFFPTLGAFKNYFIVTVNILFMGISVRHIIKSLPADITNMVFFQVDFQMFISGTNRGEHFFTNFAGKPLILITVLGHCLWLRGRGQPLLLLKWSFFCK